MVGTKEMAATRANIPRGVWDGAPAVPGTTDTPVTNNTGLDQMVRITGGTVTSVKLDGVTVLGGALAASGEWYPVRAGGTIAWVGSGAPTWQWFPWH